MGAVRGARAAAGRDGGLSEPREPLWAGGLADQPPPADDDFFAPPPPPAPVEPAPSVDRLVIVLSIMALLTFAAAGAIVTTRTGYARETVASGWQDIPMTCDTLRLDGDDGAVELFDCRAVGGGRLPPGVYRSPDARWDSDLTGQTASVNVIRITREGALTGFAAY